MAKKKSRFQEFIEEHDSTKKKLPFLHISNGYNFDKIAVGDLLKPQDCKVFKEKLLYFFYGRPSYKTKQTLNERLAYDWPVVFLFNYKTVDRFVSSCFPFDSGAFEAGRYKYFFDDSSEIEDFRFSRGNANVTRLVSAFYSDNHEYFRGGSTKNIEIPIDQFEAAGVHELVRVPNHPEAPHHLKYDERSSSIEAISRGEIKLKGNVDAIIIAKKFLEVPRWREAIDRWKPKRLKDYSVPQNMTPDAFAGMIYHIVEELTFEK